jgi:hypothetical protein
MTTTSNNQYCWEHRRRRLDEPGQQQQQDGSRRLLGQTTMLLLLLLFLLLVKLSSWQPRTIKHVLEVGTASKQPTRLVFLLFGFLDFCRLPLPRVAETVPVGRRAPIKVGMMTKMGGWLPFFALNLYHCRDRAH